MRPNCLKYRQDGTLCPCVGVFFVFFCSMEIKSGQRGGTRQKRGGGRRTSSLSFFFFLMWVALVAVLI